MASAVGMIRQAWKKLSPLPGGKSVFSTLLGKIVPYSGTIHPEVLELGAGHAKVQMRDRPGVRNHLKSVHAIALMNLAELTSGLALNVGLPDSARGIVLGLSIEYLKKARGTLTAESSFEMPDVSEDCEFDVEVVIRNEEGEDVSRARARWLIGPVRKG